MKSDSFYLGSSDLTAESLATTSGVLVDAHGAASETNYHRLVQTIGHELGLPAGSDVFAAVIPAIRNLRAPSACTYGVGTSDMKDFMQWCADERARTGLEPSPWEAWKERSRRAAASVQEVPNAG